jgi:hypothetical protein
VCPSPNYNFESGALTAFEDGKKISFIQFRATRPMEQWVPLSERREGIDWD